MTGAALKAARLALGLTQAQLAERVGKSVPTIGRYEMPANQGRYPVPFLVAQAVERMQVERDTAKETV